MRAALWTLCAAIALLTFAWPLVLPGDASYKPVAIGTFCAFVALLALACRDRLTSS